MEIEEKVALLISDKIIWDRLSNEAKNRWLQLQEDMFGLHRCSNCLNYQCDCGGEAHV
jgi:hypothetical protein